MFPSDPTQFGAWLRERREANDLTQNSLGERVGCAADTIRKIEAGRRRPSRQLAQLLAACFGVPENELDAFVRWARGGEDDAAVAAAVAGLPGIPAAPRLIGREDELAALADLLTAPQVRLVTLTGPPGIGKTSLSLAMCATLAASFRDGVHFVPLAAVDDRTLVAPAIANSLGLAPDPTRPASELLQRHLRDKRMLLVLDNFEQILPAAGIVAELLKAAPGLTVLATSRGMLRVRGEKQFPVPLLRLPGKDIRPDDLGRVPSVALFVERAQEADPAFELNGGNAAAIAAICARLEGLPLSLELAAAKSNLLRPQALLDRLEHRLALLTDGWRDLPERHQSLHAAIEWSYDILSEREQQLFRRLSVFSGGWTLASAERLVGSLGDSVDDIFSGLLRLIEQSLVRSEPAGRGVDAEPRFAMLETIREYARERLQSSGESAAALREHALLFLDRAEQATEQTSAQLMGEQDNLHAALSWALEQGEHELAGRFCAALYSFWNDQGYATEGRHWVERALLAPELPVALRALLLNGLGWLNYNQGDYTLAKEQYEAALALHRAGGNRNGVAQMLRKLSAIAKEQGEYSRADTLAEEALLLYRELGDSNGVARALLSLGNSALNQGDSLRAKRYYEESLVLLEQLDDRRALAANLLNLAAANVNSGYYAEAELILNRSQRMFEALQNPSGVAYVVLNRGSIAIAQHDYGRAREEFAAGLRLLIGLNDRPALAEVLFNLAQLAAVRQEWIKAAHFGGGAAAIRQSLGLAIKQLDQPDHDRLHANLSAGLPPAELAAAWAAGGALSADDALEEALAYTDHDLPHPTANRLSYAR